MGKITELYEQRAALSGQLTALRSSFDSADEPTDEQVAQISDLRGQVDSVTAQLHKIEATRKQLEDMQASLDATAPTARVGSAHLETPNSYSPFSIPRTTASMIEREAKGRLSPKASLIYKNDAHLATVGAQFVGALRGDQSCKEAIQAEYQEFNAVQNTQNNSQGGFLVPEDLIPRLINLREEYGDIAANANVINVNAPSGRIPRKTGAPTAVFVGEPRATEQSLQNLTFDNVNYNVKPISSFTSVTYEMDEDSIINLSALIFEESAREFARTEDVCGFNGDGTSTYGGILGIKTVLEDAAYAGSTVTAGTGEDIFVDLTNTSLTSLIAKIPRYASVGSAWFTSQEGLASAFLRLKMAAGGNTITILEGGAVSDAYAGYPIRVSEVLPADTSGTASTTALLFGNMRQSAHLFRKGGIMMARDASVRFLYGEVVYGTTQRFDFVFSERGTATAAGPMLRLKFAA